MYKIIIAILYTIGLFLGGYGIAKYNNDTEIKYKTKIKDVDTNSIVSEARRGYTKGTPEELKERFGDIYIDTNYALHDSTVIDTVDTIVVNTYNSDTTREEVILRDSSSNASVSFDYMIYSTFFSYPVYDMRNTYSFKNPHITYPETYKWHWYDNFTIGIYTHGKEVYIGVGYGINIGNIRRMF